MAPEEKRGPLLITDNSAVKRARSKWRGRDKDKEDEDHGFRSAGRGGGEGESIIGGGLDGAHRGTLRLFETTKARRHPPSTSYPLPWQSFTLAGGHRSSQWPSYPSTPATCPGNGHRPRQPLVFPTIASSSSSSTTTRRRKTNARLQTTVRRRIHPHPAHGNTGTACRPRVTLRRERLFPVPLRKSSSTTAVARLLTIVPLRPRGSRSLPTAIDSTAPPLFLGLSLGSPLGFDSSLVFLVEEENQDSNFY